MFVYLCFSIIDYAVTLMKPRNLILQLLFDAVKSPGPLSEEKHLEIISLLKEIPNLARIRRQEIECYHRIKKMSPEIKIDLPKEIHIDDPDELGSTVLILAAYFGHRELIHELVNSVNNKPDSNKQNSYGNTALMTSVAGGYDDITRELIVAGGAKLELENAKGNTAVDYALKKRKLSTLSLLLSHGALIRQPKRLFNFLYDQQDEETSLCDQRDPDLLISLTHFCEQLQKHLNLVGAEEEAPVYSQLLAQASTYRDKLNKLTDSTRKKAVAEIDAVTGNIISPTLLAIIGEFDAPLQDQRIRFFKPEAIDSLLLLKEESKNEMHPPIKFQS